MPFFNKPLGNYFSLRVVLITFWPTPLLCHDKTIHRAGWHAYVGRIWPDLARGPYFSYIDAANFHRWKKCNQIVLTFPNEPHPDSMGLIVLICAKKCSAEQESITPTKQNTKAQSNGTKQKKCHSVSPTFVVKIHYIISIVSAPVAFISLLCVK